MDEVDLDLTPFASYLEDILLAQQQQQQQQPQQDPINWLQFKGDIEATVPCSNILDGEVSDSSSNNAPNHLLDNDDDDDGNSGGKRKRGSNNKSSTCMDEAEKKRKNREAAQQSRQRKKMYIETMEEESQRLKKENETLKQQRDVLSTENSVLKQMLQMFSTRSFEFPKSFYPCSDQSTSQKASLSLALVFSVGVFFAPEEWPLLSQDFAVAGGPRRMLLHAETDHIVPNHHLQQFVSPKAALSFLLGLCIIWMIVSRSSYLRRKRE